MRLLNTVTFQFKTFFDYSIPNYAILSHRWGNQEEEVSHKQLRKNLVPPDSPGLVKIQNFCRLAAERGFPWAWIDTCCIDKRSSAELSQAINSMYKWYELSAECYVYLADVEFSVGELSLKRQSEERFWHTPGGWSTLRDRFIKSLEIALPKKHLQLSSQDGRTIRFFLRCSRAPTENAQTPGKALYVELDLMMGPKSGIRINCATLKETSTPPDKSEYLIGQLHKDLANNERIYVFSPDSPPSGYWGTLL